MRVLINTLVKLINFYKTIFCAYHVSGALTDGQLGKIALILTCSDWKSEKKIVNFWNVDECLRIKQNYLSLEFQSLPNSSGCSTTESRDRQFEHESLYCMPSCECHRYFRSTHNSTNSHTRDKMNAPFPNLITFVQLLRCNCLDFLRGNGFFNSKGIFQFK